MNKAAHNSITDEVNLLLKMNEKIWQLKLATYPVDDNSDFVNVSVRGTEEDCRGLRWMPYHGTYRCSTGV